LQAKKDSHEEVDEWASEIGGLDEVLVMLLVCEEHLRVGSVRIPLGAEL